MDKGTCAEALRSVREKRPLVHHITNYVTVNDCANATLCIGGSPVMADAPEEVEQMVSLAGALVLNIGTLNVQQIGSMIIAGREANRRGIPIIMDPVGAGATAMRTEAACRLLKELHVSVLKGNGGEIGVLAGTGGIVRGVDSEGMSGDPASIVKELAGSMKIIVAMSGARDLVSDGRRTFAIDNGDSMMGRISGTGCMATSVVGAFSAAHKDPLEAVVGAFVAFGIAGERAALKANGPGTFKPALFDAMAALTPEGVLEHARLSEV
ncbi:MAG: hydroxyethylthiazole kinase [Euryarchaeota archaeon]|nr:hydroxyethylthiazole kinase [Euryarchaeota archaeon]